MKKLFILIPVAMIVGAAAWFWPHRQEADRGEFKAFGNIDIRTVNLAFRVGGRLTRLEVEEGDRVEPGALLAELDAEPQRIALAAAQAQERGAAAKVAKLRAGFRPEELESAKAAVSAAEASSTRAHQEKVRQSELADTGASTPQALEAAEAAAAEAAARLRQAQAQRALLEAGYRAEDVAQAEAELAATRAQLADAQRQIDDARLTAPSSGIVQTRVVEPGTIVAPGQTVLNLALTEKTWVRAYLPEPQLGQIHPGQKALVYTDSRPDEPYSGQIGFISPTAEFTPKNIETTELRSALVFRFHIVIENPDDGLRQGMPVTVRLAQ